MEVVIVGLILLFILHKWKKEEIEGRERRKKEFEEYRQFFRETTGAVYDEDGYYVRTEHRKGKAND